LRKADSELLRVVLDEAYMRLCDVYISSSVLGPVREFSGREDLELWGLFCALIDYQVPVISRLIPMLRGLRLHLHNEKLSFYDLIYDEEIAGRVLAEFRWFERDKKGFSHRFVKINHILHLFEGLRGILEEGSLREHAQRIYEETAEDEFKGGKAIRDFTELLWSRLHNSPLPRGFIPNPRGNSTLKRICLFFRWMVRPYPDLNIWGDFFPIRELMVCLGSEITRVINRILNEKYVKEHPTWKDVEKVTLLLREINPDDPSKYDYVLSRPSIMGYCRKRVEGSKCTVCPLFEACRTGRREETKILRTKRKLSSEREQRILQSFLRKFSGKYRIKEIYTEYPIGRRSIDLVFTDEEGKWWVCEVEEYLNYTAIGQAVAYRRLFHKYRRIRPNSMIICRTSNPELVETCKYDCGVEVTSIK